MNSFLRPLIISMLLLAATVGAHAQNNSPASKNMRGNANQGSRALTVTDIMKFRQLRSPSISNDGLWVVHSAVPDRGDPEVLVYSSKGNTKYTLSMADKPELSEDGKWVAAVKTVPAVQLPDPKPEKELGEKPEADEGPKTGLYLLNTSTGAVDTIENVQSFLFSNDGKWLFYHCSKDTGNINDKSTGKIGEEMKASGKENIEKEGPNNQSTAKEGIGTTLHMLSLEDKSQNAFPFVTTYAIDSISRHLAFVVSDTSVKRNGAYMHDLTNPGSEAQTLYADSALWANYLSWNTRTGQLAFLAGISGEKGAKENADLFLWSPGDEKARSVLKDADLSLNQEKVRSGERYENPKEEWKIYHTNSLRWSLDGKRLFLGVKPSSEIIPPDNDELCEEYEGNGKTDKCGEPEACDSVPDLFDTEEILSKREVDVWHWNDPYINSHQKKLWKRIKDRTYTGVYFPETNTFTPLASKEIPDLRVSESSSSLLASSNLPYAKRVTWDGRYSDYYLVDIQNGEKQLAIEAQQHSVSLSPDGKILVWFSDGDWYMMDVSTQKQRNLTSRLKVPFADEDWDYPEDTPDYRIGGWIDNSKAVFIYDKYDIWLFPASGGDALCLTEGLGREEKIQFRIKNLDRDRRYFEHGEPLLLSAYHDTKKYTSIYTMKAGLQGLEELAGGPKKYSLTAKARDADKLLFTRQSYREFPDLWVSGMDMKKAAKLTDVNPQTAEFAWGNAELVEWSSMDGKPLQGILIKPDNYEPGKPVPVLVYYYRFFSQRLFDFNQVAINHRPCFPFYASNGYAIFLPDISFDIGNPGYAATKCLVPGVQKIIDMGLADPNAVCLHGHSWSGYQTAFVITQTDMFACAIAGAPVSNMTSAYGGIRWESGLARQFQYEKTQSRIGGSLWEDRDKYIENSPVFFADRINTPLLIQFGDVDGAVPWYQGIELYLAMRRLEKDCVFLQYRGEPHHLKKYPNKLDYTLKFKEYMDHYLKGDPAPEWLEKGVPYNGK